MFKGMYPVFWVGLVIMYGFAIGSMLVEMITDVGTVHTTLWGIPLPFLYNMFFLLWILPMVIALMWYWVPKKAKEQRDQQQTEEG